MGDNSAAQTHAQSLRDECFVSHWGLDGLKPYMRYTLAGGYQANAENANGYRHCTPAVALTSVEEGIREAMDTLMQSRGHRDDILFPWHRKVNIGIAWDGAYFWTGQQFEGDYVVYEELPAIEDGVLRVSGMLKNGGTLRSPDDLYVEIHYDPPPEPLTKGQLSVTTCYDQGAPLAALDQPPPPGTLYAEPTWSSAASPPSPLYPSWPRG